MKREINRLEQYSAELIGFVYKLKTFNEVREYIKAIQNKFKNCIMKEVGYTIKKDFKNEWKEMLLFNKL